CCAKPLFGPPKRRKQPKRYAKLKHGKKSYKNAAQLNIKCREHGITIRSTIDLIIAEIALENNLFILHNDNDYTNMAKVITELKMY
ncbi:MAG: VapC toxin family PIN domain ribonuclease, partial [Treponema sp.]|nr:VapC toxin family PIN domain ribonuclease [Treponema sp.]